MNLSRNHVSGVDQPVIAQADRLPLDDQVEPQLVRAVATPIVLRQHLGALFGGERLGPRLHQQVMQLLQLGDLLHQFRGGAAQAVGHLAAKLLVYQLERALSFHEHLPNPTLYLTAGPARATLSSMTDRPPKIELIPKKHEEAPERLPSAAILPDVPADSSHEAALRMPSVVMRMETAEKSAPSLESPVMRRAYAPPKLGPPIPGKVKMVEPTSVFISQWIAALIRALRGMSIYADNNVRRKEFIDQSFHLLEEIFAKIPKFELVIEPEHIASGRDIVHFNPDHFESLPRLLYEGSVRRLIFQRDVKILDLVRFLSVTATDFSRPENAQYDIVSLLERMGLENIRAIGPAPAPRAHRAYVPPPAPVVAAPPPPPPPPAPAPRAPEPAEDQNYVDPFAGDDEATVLAQPAKKYTLDTMDDEATVQEPSTAPLIDVSDLNDETTTDERIKPRR